MCGSVLGNSFEASQWRPSMRSPVPQSRIRRDPSGVVSSTQAVFPPYRHVARSTVGVEPRTPQNLSRVTRSSALRRIDLALGSAVMDSMGTTRAQKVTIFHTMHRLRRSQLSSGECVRYTYASSLTAHSQ